MELPSLPDQFVARTGLVDAALAALRRPVGTLGLVGMGGAGKSTLAAAIATDERVPAGFGDGVLWVAVGPEPDLTACLGALCAGAGDPAPVGTVTAGRDRLRGLLAGGRWLIVLDNVWDAAALRALDLGLPTVRLLVTARSRDVLPAGAAVLPVGPVADDLARAILARYAGTEPPATADAVLDRSGGLVLALAVAGGMVADGGDWADVAGRLARADLDALPDYPYPSLLGALDASVSALPRTDRRRYLDLAVFAGRGPVPPEVAARLWLATAGLDEPAAKEQTSLFARRSLLRVDQDSGALILHDLLFDYVVGAVGDGLAVLHGRFADALLADWGPGLDAPRRAGTTGWLDRYALRHLAGHLVAAGRDADLHDLLAVGWPTGENAWYALHERAALPGAYLADLRLAWRRADAAGDVPRRIRYALMTGSVVALANNLPVELLDRLLATGQWSPDRGHAYAASLTTAAGRVAALTAVVPHLPAAEQAAAVEEAWQAGAAILDPVGRAGALAGLADRLPTGRWDALATAAADRAAGLDGAASRARELGRLADCLTGARRERANALALAACPAIEEELTRALTLGRLARHASPEQLGTVLDLVLALGHPGERARALAAVAAHLPPELARRAWPAAPDLRARGYAARALVALAPHVPPADAAAAVAAAWAAAVDADPMSFQRAEALAALAPQLPADLRAAGLVTAWAAVAAETEVPRAAAIEAIAPHLPADMLDAAVTAAAAIRFGQFRVQALVALGPRLPVELLARALDAGRSLGGWRLVARLAPYLPVELLPQAAGVTLVADVPAARARALGDLGPELPPDQRAAVLDLALDATLAVEDPGDRAGCLAHLAGHLDADQLDRAVADADRIADPVGRIAVLSAVLPALGRPRADEVLGRAWDTFQTIGAPATQLDALVSLAPRLTTDLAATAADRVETWEPGRTRTAALDHLAPRLPADRRRAVLSARLAAGSAYQRPRTLAGLVPVLPPAEGRELLTEALTAEPVGHRVELLFTLQEIAPLLPADLFPLALERLLTIPGQPAAQAMDALAPHLPAAAVPAALDTAPRLSEVLPAARALAALGPRLPADLLPRAVELALAFDDPDARATALTGLAPVLPEVLLAVASRVEGAHDVTAGLLTAAAARASGGLRGAYWDRLRAGALAAAAADCRAAVLALIPAVLAEAPPDVAAADPVPVDASAEDPASAAVTAVADVLRWWP